MAESLYAPSISLSEDILTIKEVSGALRYRIYYSSQQGEFLLAELIADGDMQINILSLLMGSGYTEPGQYQLFVVAVAGAVLSTHSNVVIYLIAEPAEYRIQRDTLSSIANAIRLKLSSHEEIDVSDFASKIEEIKVSDATSAPLQVTQNGEYTHTYEPVTIEWGADSDYDFTIEQDGVPLRVKKVQNMSVPSDIRYLQSMGYSVTLTTQEGSQTIPFSELEVVSLDENGSVFLINDLVYAVIWVRDSAVANMVAGSQVFEDNSVYISDYIFLMAGEEATGLTVSLTAPGPLAQLISSVTVDAAAELQEKSVELTSLGYHTIYPDEGMDGFSSVSVRVNLPYYDGTITVS